MEDINLYTKVDISTLKKPHLYIITIGHIFDNNEVTDPTLLKKGDSKSYYIKVKCLICNNERYVQIRHLMRGYSKSCRSCREDLKNGGGNIHHAWKGIGNMSKGLYNQFKNGAISRNIPFEVTMEEIWELFLKQDGKCALTGLPLTIHSRRKIKSKIDASLDRIDSTKPYVKQNLQWLHKDVNRMKNKFSDNRFIEICNLVSKKWPLNPTQ
jgi:ribosomal protein S27E